VELLVPGMEYVAWHELTQTGTAKWRSNAAVRSAAMDCGERPSI
jgi:hypothetical protein